MNHDPKTSVDVHASEIKLGLPDRFESKGIIGQGGMGVVFRAFDKQLQREVAIKVLFITGVNDEENVGRFTREAKALALLDNPNIVKILSWGVNEDGHPYYVMEFVDGTSLSTLLADGKPLSATRFFAIFNQVLSGLEHAHRHKIVHRDLKPSNIILCETPDGPCAKIIDFGIARVLDAGNQSFTKTNHLIGSPMYMSPEQCKAGKVDHLSDLYSLGCVMYESLVGRPPFSGDSALEVMYKHMSESAPVLEQTCSAETRELGKLIDRCLAKDPQSRPQSAQEVLDNLAQISFQHKIDTGKLHMKAASPNKNQLIITLAAAMILIAGVLGLAILYLKKPIETNSILAGNVAKSAKRVEDLTRSVNLLENLYRNDRGPDTLFGLANRLLELADAQNEMNDFAGSLKTLNRAMSICPEMRKAGDPSYLAKVFLHLGTCNFHHGDIIEAERMCERGMACVTDYATQVQLAHLQGIARARLHSFDAIAEDISLLSQARSTAMNSGDFFYRRSKGISKEAAGVPALYDICMEIGKQKPVKSVEKLSALKVLAMGAHSLLNMRCSKVNDVMGAVSDLIRQIPADTPGFKSTAILSYKLLARYEDEVVGNAENAASYASLAASFK